MSNRFTQFIIGAMVLGIVMGAAIFNFLPDSRVEIAGDINLVAVLFLRLIKMIIAPLVFATLVGGIAHMGGGARLGRIFAKTMGWFVSASFISLDVVCAYLCALCFVGVALCYVRLRGLTAERLVLVFSTAAWEAAYPKTLEGLNKSGPSSRFSAFVLPTRRPAV